MTEGVQSGLPGSSFFPCCHAVLRGDCSPVSPDRYFGFLPSSKHAFCAFLKIRRDAFRILCPHYFQLRKLSANCNVYFMKNQKDEVMTEYFEFLRGCVFPKTSDFNDS